MAFLVADAKLAGQALGLEAVLVGLHDIDGGTLRSLTSVLRVPAAVIVIKFDKVDTSGAFTADAADIDVKLQGATKVVVPVRPVGRVVHSVVKDEGTIIKTHRNLVIVSLEVLSIKASHKELPSAVIAAGAVEALHLGGFRLGIGLILIIFFLSAVVFLIVRIGIGSRLRLWARLRGRIVSRIFSIAPLVDLEVGDLVDGVFTACSGSRAHFRALFDGGVSAISVIPGGDNEAHAAFDVTAEGPEVVLAASFHHDLVGALGDSCAHLPEFSVVIVGNELGFDGELVCCLDHGAIGTVGVLSVFLLALFEHIVLALALVITVAIGAGMGGHVEAIWVGLHDVNAGARGGHHTRRHLCVRNVLLGLSVALAVHSDSVDASYTATAMAAQVHSVLDSATADVGLVGVFIAFVRLSLE